MGEEDIKMESWLWNVVELKKKNSLKAIWLIKVISYGEFCAIQ